MNDTKEKTKWKKLVREHEEGKSISNEVLDCIWDNFKDEFPTDRVDEEDVFIMCHIAKIYDDAYAIGWKQGTKDACKKTNSSK